MFLPMPIFWALDDQQGSVWVVQATQMDSRLWGTFHLSPDQLQALNTVLLFAFIPFFQVAFTTNDYYCKCVLVRRLPFAVESRSRDSPA